NKPSGVSNAARDEARRLRTANTQSGTATRTPDGRPNPASNPNSAAGPHWFSRAKITAHTMSAIVRDSAYPAKRAKLAGQTATRSSIRIRPLFVRLEAASRNNPQKKKNAAIVETKRAATVAGSSQLTTRIAAGYNG